MVRFEVYFPLVTVVGLLCIGSCKGLDKPQSHVRRASSDDEEFFHKFTKEMEDIVEDDTILDSSRSMQQTSKMDGQAIGKNVTTTISADQTGSPLLDAILVQVVAYIGAFIFFIILIIVIQLNGGIFGDDDSIRPLVSVEGIATSFQIITDFINDALREVNISANGRNDTIASKTASEDRIGDISDIKAALEELKQGIASIVDVPKTSRNGVNINVARDQVDGPIIKDILIQIVELLSPASTDIIYELIVGTIAGGPVASDYVEGIELAGLVNTTELTNMVNTNVTVSIIEVTSNGTTTVTEEQFIESIIPEIVVLVVTAVSDAIINAIDEFVESEEIMVVLINIIDQVTTPLIDFLISELLTNDAINSTVFGTLNTTALDNAVIELASTVSAASSTGTVRTGAFDRIVTETLPSIVEPMILIIAQAIANAINDVIFAGVISSRSNLVTAPTTSTNTTTAVSEDTIIDILVVLLFWLLDISITFDRNLLSIPTKPTNTTTAVSDDTIIDILVVLLFWLLDIMITFDRNLLSIPTKATNTTTAVSEDTIEILLVLLLFCLLDITITFDRNLLSIPTTTTNTTTAVSDDTVLGQLLVICIIILFLIINGGFPFDPASTGSNKVDNSISSINTMITLMSFDSDTVGNIVKDIVTNDPIDKLRGFLGGRTRQ